METKLSAEQRKVVAEGCPLVPEPYVRNIDFRSLTTKIAQLIERDFQPPESIDRWPMLRRFSKALATGKTDDLELLCYELLSDKGE